VSKLLLFVLVLAAIFWGRRLLNQLGQQGRNPGRGASRPKEGIEKMLSCQRCGIHVPESEGVHRDGAFFCCDAHAQGRDD
jgi:uncharacterized protein